MPGDRFLTGIAKRLGEDRFFSGAFVVYCHIFIFFRVFCLVVKRNFVYLQAVKGVATISFPEYLNVNKI